MKKFLRTSLILVIVACLVLPLTACGKKEEEKNGSKSSKTDTKNDKTTSLTLSESYTKFTEAKGEMIENLSNVEDFTIAMTIFSLTMIDLLALPATVCGLDEASARMTLSFLYSDIVYKDEGGGKYLLTYSSEGDEGDEEGKFIANYDERTDSAQMELYYNSVLALNLEYIKTEGGYAAQYFLYNEDGTYSLYKIIFDKKDIAIGMFEGDGTESSIYKGNAKFAKDWAESEAFYLEHVGGVTKSVIEGNEKTY